MYKPHLIIYHGNCSDGFVAGLVAYASRIARIYEAPVGPDQHTLFVPVNVSRLEEEIDRLPDAGLAWAFDVSFTKKTFEKFINRYPGARVFDHHISSKKEIGDHPSFTFDNEMSGATLAWKFFYPDRRIPQIVSYVEDRDLWRNKLPHTKEVCAWLYDQIGRSFGLDPATGFQAWLPYILHDSWVEEAKTKGRVMLEQQQSEVSWIVKTARIVNLREKKVAVVNTMLHISDVGDRLCITLPVDYSLMWYYDHSKGQFKVSLRSGENGADVSQIASACGGGGHKHAAGFEATLEFMFLLFKASSV